MNKWVSAWFSASRYVLYNTTLAFSGWLVGVKERWNELTSWDEYNLACLLVLAALAALGAIMNGSWKEARDAAAK